MVGCFTVGCFPVLFLGFPLFFLVLFNLSGGGAAKNQVEGSFTVGFRFCSPRFSFAAIPKRM